MCNLEQSAVVILNYWSQWSELSDFTPKYYNYPLKVVVQTNDSLSAQLESSNGLHMSFMITFDKVCSAQVTI